MKFLLRILIIVFLFRTSKLYAQCYYKLSMYDSWGDGWNGAYLEVTMNGSFVGNYECFGSYTLDSVYSLSGTTMDFIFHSGTWDSEITFWGNHFVVCVPIIKSGSISHISSLYKNRIKRRIEPRLRLQVCRVMISSLWS